MLRLLFLFCFHSQIPPFSHLLLYLNPPHCSRFRLLFHPLTPPQVLSVSRLPQQPPVVLLVRLRLVRSPSVRLLLSVSSFRLPTLWVASTSLFNLTIRSLILLVPLLVR